MLRSCIRNRSSWSVDQHIFALTDISISHTDVRVIICLSIRYIVAHILLEKVTVEISVFDSRPVKMKNFMLLNCMWYSFCRRVNHHVFNLTNISISRTGIRVSISISTGQIVAQFFLEKYTRVKITVFRTFDLEKLHFHVDQIHFAQHFHRSRHQHCGQHLHLAMLKQRWSQQALTFGAAAHVVAHLDRELNYSAHSRLIIAVAKFLEEEIKRPTLPFEVVGELQHVNWWLSEFAFHSNSAYDPNETHDESLKWTGKYVTSPISPTKKIKKIYEILTHPRHYTIRNLHFSNHFVKYARFFLWLMNKFTCEIPMMCVL